MNPGRGLAGRGLPPPETGALSFVAILAAVLGMMFGQRIRQRLPEARFRRVFFGALLAPGAYIAWRAFL